MQAVVHVVAVAAVDDDWSAWGALSSSLCLVCCCVMYQIKANSPVRPALNENMRIR